MVLDCIKYCNTGSAVCDPEIYHQRREDTCQITGEQKETCNQIEMAGAPGTNTGQQPESTGYEETNW